MLRSPAKAGNKGKYLRSFTAFGYRLCLCLSWCLTKIPPHLVDLPLLPLPLFIVLPLLYSLLLHFKSFPSDYNYILVSVTQLYQVAKAFIAPWIFICSSQNFPVPTLAVRWSHEICSANGLWEEMHHFWAEVFEIQCMTLQLSFPFSKSREAPVWGGGLTKWEQSWWSAHNELPAYHSHIYKR